MLRKLLGTSISKADIQDQKMVLSLTDAMTPAVWVIDLSDKKSLLFKVQETEDHLFILQKICGENTEDLGYYKKRGHAVRAMEKATCALQGTSDTSAVFQFLKNLIGIGLVIWLGYMAVTFVMKNDLIPSEITFPFMGENTSTSKDIAAQTPQTEQPQQPVVRPSNNPDAVGVPLSADEFLQRRQPKSVLPF
jgi:hypothetical protein